MSIKVKVEVWDDHRSSSTVELPPGKATFCKDIRLSVDNIYADFRANLRAYYRRAFHDICEKSPLDIPKPSCKILVKDGVTRKSRFAEVFKLKPEDLIQGGPVTMAFVYRVPEDTLPTNKSPRKLVWKTTPSPVTRVAPYRPYRPEKPRSMESWESQMNSQMNKKAKKDKSGSVKPRVEKAKFLQDLKKVNQRMKADQAAVKKKKEEETSRQVRAIVEEMSVPFSAPISPIRSPGPSPLTSTPKKGSVTLYRPAPNPTLYRPRTTVVEGQRSHSLAKGKRAYEDKRFGYNSSGRLTKF